ncbi:hypothetical protein NHF46_21560 [Arthrobacter alpinus]|nr:hypothetical protein [Arthrobacter alpinus]
MPVDVAFTASLAKPLNTTNFILALIVALVLGPGIPLVLLYLAKWLVAKIPGSSLSAELIPITVAYGQVERDGVPFALRPTDLVQLLPIDPGGVRSLSVSGVNFKARMGRSPLGTGYVSVDSPTVWGFPRHTQAPIAREPRRVCRWPSIIIGCCCAIVAPTRKAATC